MATSGNGFFLQVSTENTEDSGYDFQFVNCDDYQCIICLKIIKDFVELPCGHAGCDGCINRWEEKNM